MEFKEYMKIKQRIVKSIGGCPAGCKACPLNNNNTGLNCGCAILETEYPAKAEKIVKKWADEHLVITNAQKLQQVFGLSEEQTNIYRETCPPNKLESICTLKCEECKKWWDKEYKEPKAQEERKHER